MHAACRPHPNFFVAPHKLPSSITTAAATKAASSSESSLFFLPIKGIWRKKCLAFHLRTRQNINVQSRGKTKQLSDKDSSGRLDKVIREILHYCVHYPDAKDTPEGILKWWLAEGRGEWGKEDIQEALDSLTGKGWLLKRKTRQSEEIYGLNKEHLQEITDFMTQAKWH
jgi:hypothetical protein